MGEEMPTHAWLIQGFDGLRPIFRRRLSPVLSELEIRKLLQRLASQSLTHNEIIAGSLRRRMKEYKPLLEVKKDPGRRIVYYCGEDPHYVAGLFAEHEFAEMDL